MTHYSTEHKKWGLKERFIRSILLPLLTIGVAFSFAGCNDKDEGSIRVIHTSSDAPPVNVKLNGDVAISNLDYANSSGFVKVDAKDYRIAVEGIIPGGNVDVITVPNFTVTKDSRTTIIATDNVASITPLVVSDSATKPTSNEVALRVVHASAAADALVAAVDVYVTGPTDDIMAANPAFSFAFTGDVDAGALPADVVRIRVTAAGSKSPVYDSGPVDLAPFAGNKLLIAAIDTSNSIEQDAAPIKLLVATDDAQLALLDVNTGTGARVVHASPDAGAAAMGPVEVFASSTALPMSPVELIDAFDYLETRPAAEPFYNVPAGDYVFDVAPNTNMIGDSVFTSDSITLTQGSEYTVVAAGRVTATPAFDLLLTEEHLRAVATQASVKVIHAAPLAGIVQVYVTNAGDFTASEVAAGMAGAPLLPNFAFGDITPDVAVAPGNYDIRVVAGGSVAINVEDFALAAGSVSTIIARGPLEPVTDPNDFGVIVLTN